MRLHNKLVHVCYNYESFTISHFITDLSVVANNGFYTSGSDDRAEGIFEWTDTGTPYPITYSNWQPGQPNNVGSNQDCLLLQYPDDDLTWGDVDCGGKHPFICEINQTL